MKSFFTIKINFPGGIISPGDLYNILVASNNHHIGYVSFGLRQQLYMEVDLTYLTSLSNALNQLGVCFEIETDKYPNIASSYPAEDIFINNTWLSEGVYKDILDLIDYTPTLKINISDSNQSFTPLLTGNINWVASTSQHFWHVFIRFPKTNIVYEWDYLVYTNDVARMSKAIENIILQYPSQFIDNSLAKGDELFQLLKEKKFITQKATTKATLPDFNLPYYEGLNKYHDKYWLGIYRRDEKFSIPLLKDICKLCLNTKVGQLCATPWKSIIIKSISEKDRPLWNQLLSLHHINMRHAANELNFQVEDNCQEGLALKQYLIKSLNDEDVRTFGLCIGIKTRKKSEVFSSILVRKKPLLKIGNFEWGNVYDILCAKDFNPNERTGFVYSSNNPKWLLAEQLRRAIVLFQQKPTTEKTASTQTTSTPSKQSITEAKKEWLHQCSKCLTVYDQAYGDAEKGIALGTSFESLPDTYHCSLCESGKEKFNIIEKATLLSETV